MQRFNVGDQVLIKATVTEQLTKGNMIRVVTGDEVLFVHSRDILGYEDIEDNEEPVCEACQIHFDDLDGGGSDD